MYLHCPLSRHDLIYISLRIIFCINEYVMNKKALNLELLLIGLIIRFYFYLKYKFLVMFLCVFIIFISMQFFFFQLYI